MSENQPMAFQGGGLASFRFYLRAQVRSPLLMGILNVTPDSFSDGNQYLDSGAAVAHVLAMEDSGARIIDVGGESTRPGAKAVEAAEQIRRVIPVISRLAGKVRGIISVDTGSAAVARAAVDAGASMINDVSAGTWDEAMLETAGKLNVPIVLMHSRGKPATMQGLTTYEDVVGEVKTYLRDRIKAALTAGIAREDVLVDPGIGFAKTARQNLLLLQHVGKLAKLGPVVVGASRKSFIEKVTGETAESRRVFGTAAAVAWCAGQGVSIHRVHDVTEMSRVAKMIDAIMQASLPDNPPSPV